jgi:hypothetical protein
MAIQDLPDAHKIPPERHAANGSKPAARWYNRYTSLMRLRISISFDAYATVAMFPA